jgi:predicted nucleic acid-binding protein
MAEIEKGICRLPDGKRKNELRADFEGFMLDAFSGRVFPFGESEADAFGALAGAKLNSGFNTSSMDLMIAAIALTHNAKLATRNTRDFEGRGIALINPWQATGPS